MLKENRFKFDKTGNSLIDRALKVFVIFPYNPSYIDMVLEEINPLLEQNHGANISHSQGYLNSISVITYNYGSFIKYFEIDTDFYDKECKKSQFECCCRMFSDENNYAGSEDKIFWYKENKTKKEVDFVCQCLVPYLITGGRFKEGLPLLVNILPEFTKNFLIN